MNTTSAVSGIPDCNRNQAGRSLRPHRWSATRAIQFVVLLASLLAAFSVSQARTRQSFDDDKKDSELKTIHGVVVDKSENGVPSSIVYLQNMKTEAVRTYIADESGNYRFSGLDPNEDYQIHAEKGDLTSSIRTISSYDSRRDIEVVLKLIHSKDKK